MSSANPIPIPIPIPSPSLPITCGPRSSTSSFPLPTDSGYASRTQSAQVSPDRFPRSKIHLDTADPPPPQHVASSPLPGRQDLLAFRIDPDARTLARYREILPEMQVLIQRHVQAAASASASQGPGGMLAAALLPLAGVVQRRSKRGRHWQQRSSPAPPPMAIRLMVVGRTVETAKPTIVVFFGGEPAQTKALEGLMRQPVMKGLCCPDDGTIIAARFEVLVIGDPPRKRYSHSQEGGAMVVWDGGLMRGRGAVTYCGMRIRLGVGEEKTAVATLGGLIRLVGQDGEVKVVGMTAGHVLEGLFYDDDEEEEDEEDEGGEEEQEEVLEYWWFDQEESRGIRDSKRTPSTRILGQLLYPRIPRKSEEEEEEEEEEEGADNFIPARDWALFEMNSAVKLKPNIFRLADPALEQNTFQRQQGQEMRVAPPGSFPSLSFIEVVMISQCHEPRGVKLGHLSHLPGGFMLDPEKGFVEAYLLKLDDGDEIQDGDSGAWIVNPISKEVYGHVAATDYTGDAYVIPLHATFEDIKHELGVRSVALPTTSDLLNIALQATTTAATAPGADDVFQRQTRISRGLEILTARESSRNRDLSELLSLYDRSCFDTKRLDIVGSDRDSGYCSLGTPVRLSFVENCHTGTENSDEDEYRAW